MTQQLFEESKEACRAVADKVEDMDEDLTSMEIKMMLEEELGYGLEKEEIIILALTFKHIDKLFEEDKPNSKKMIYW
ncbi:MAG: hypothetical protein ACLFSM_07825 [Thermoplasmata archaeon]